LDPHTPSRCDHGGPVNPSLPYAQLRIDLRSTRHVAAVYRWLRSSNRLLLASGRRLDLKDRFTLIGIVRLGWSTPVALAVHQDDNAASVLQSCHERDHH
jgi:hypothetical protein